MARRKCQFCGFEREMDEIICAQCQYHIAYMKKKAERKKAEETKKFISQQRLVRLED